MNERLMTFIDGSNLLRAIGVEIGVDIRSNKPPDTALTLAAEIVTVLHERLRKEAFCYGFKRIRSYWFGSIKGDDVYKETLMTNLRSLGFEPIIFKQKSGKEKRVDLAVAREMLIQASGHNHELALLVAGDEDYIDVVNDLKRLGVRVMGSFYQTGLSPALKVSFDYFHELHIWGDQRKKLVGELGGKLPD